MNKITDYTNLYSAWLCASKSNPGRSLRSVGKFNGMEKDPEGMGGGGSTYDYGFRIYNAQIAKFLSMDPLFQSFPWYTTYQFAGNKPIIAIDLDGLEEYIIVKWTENEQLMGMTIIRVPKDVYIAEVNSQYDKYEKQVKNNIASDKEYYKGRKLKARMAQHTSTLKEIEASRRKALVEVEANYSKALIVNKSGGNTHDFSAQQAESSTILSNPSAYVSGQTLTDMVNIDPRDQLILNQGLVSASKLSSADNVSYQNYLQGGAINVRIPQVMNVNFESNSASLDNVDKSALDNLYAAMVVIPDLKVHLTGHTDNVGTPGANMDLSIARVGAAKDYLVSKGISGDRITTSGAGQSQPTSTNDTDQGRAQNRRIEVTQQ